MAETVEEDALPFVCNNCLCDIDEFRYKCLTCPDFDLCENCQGLDCEIGNHNFEHHIVLKICTKLVETGSDYVGNMEDTFQDLQETLAVLDAIQFFYFDVEAMATNLRMPIALIRQKIDRMIEREYDFSKTERYSYLEICNDSGIATGSGVTKKLLVNNHLQLDSLWVSILTLADEESRPDLEAAREILVVEEAYAITADNPCHSLSALKRCNNISGDIAMLRRWQIRKKFMTVSLVAVQGLSKKRALSRKKLLDAIKLESRSKTQKAMSDIFDYAQSSWLNGNTASLKPLPLLLSSIKVTPDRNYDLELMRSSMNYVDDQIDSSTVFSTVTPLSLTSRKDTVNNGGIITAKQLLCRIFSKFPVSRAPFNFRISGVTATVSDLGSSFDDRVSVISEQPLYRIFNKLPVLRAPFGFRIPDVASNPSDLSSTLKRPTNIGEDASHLVVACSNQNSRYKCEEVKDIIRKRGPSSSYGDSSTTFPERSFNMDINLEHMQELGTVRSPPEHYQNDSEVLHKSKDIKESEVKRISWYRSVFPFTFKNCNCAFTYERHRAAMPVVYLTNLEAAPNVDMINLVKFDRGDDESDIAPQLLSIKSSNSDITPLSISSPFGEDKSVIAPHILSITSPKSDMAPLSKTPHVYSPSVIKLPLPPEAEAINEGESPYRKVYDLSAGVSISNGSSRKSKYPRMDKFEDADHVQEQILGDPQLSKANSTSLQLLLTYCSDFASTPLPTSDADPILAHCENLSPLIGRSLPFQIDDETPAVRKESTMKATFPQSIHGIAISSPCSIKILFPFGVVSPPLSLFGGLSVPSATCDMGTERVGTHFRRNMTNFRSSDSCSASTPGIINSEISFEARDLSVELLQSVDNSNGQSYDLCRDDKSLSVSSQSPLPIGLVVFPLPSVRGDLPVYPLLTTHPILQSTHLPSLPTELSTVKEFGQEDLDNDLETTCSRISPTCALLTSQAIPLLHKSIAGESLETPSDLDNADGDCIITNRAPISKDSTTCTSNLPSCSPVDKTATAIASSIKENIDGDATLYENVTSLVVPKSVDGAFSAVIPDLSPLIKSSSVDDLHANLDLADGTFSDDFTAAKIEALGPQKEVSSAGNDSKIEAEPGPLPRGRLSWSSFHLPVKTECGIFELALGSMRNVRRRRFSSMDKTKLDADSQSSLKSVSIHLDAAQNGATTSTLDFADLLVKEDTKSVTTVNSASKFSLAGTGSFSLLTAKSVTSHGIVDKTKVQPLKISWFADGGVSECKEGTLDSPINLIKSIKKEKKEVSWFDVDDDEAFGFLDSDNEKETANSVISGDDGHVLGGSTASNLPTIRDNLLSSNDRVPSILKTRRLHTSAVCGNLIAYNGNELPGAEDVDTILPPKKRVRFVLNTEDSLRGDTHLETRRNYNENAEEIISDVSFNINGMNFSNGNSPARDPASVTEKKKLRFGTDDIYHEYEEVLNGKHPEENYCRRENEEDGDSSSCAFTYFQRFPSSSFPLSTSSLSLKFGNPAISQNDETVDTSSSEFFTRPEQNQVVETSIEGQAGQDHDFFSMESGTNFQRIDKNHLIVSNPPRSKIIDEGNHEGTEGADQNNGDSLTNGDNKNNRKADFGIDMEITSETEEELKVTMPRVICDVNEVGSGEEKDNESAGEPELSLTGDRKTGWDEMTDDDLFDESPTSFLYSNNQPFQSSSSQSPKIGSVSDILPKKGKNKKIHEWKFLKNSSQSSSQAPLKDDADDEDDLFNDIFDTPVKVVVNSGYYQKL